MKQYTSCASKLEGKVLRLDNKIMLFGHWISVIQVSLRSYVADLVDFSLGMCHILDGSFLG